MPIDVPEQIRQLASVFDDFVDDVTADEVIERFSATAETQERTGDRQLLDDRHRRATSRSLGVAAAAVLLVAGLVGALAWVDRGGSGPSSSTSLPATDGSTSAAALGPFVWPAPPRDYSSLNELVDAFADEVLNWDEFDVGGDPDDAVEPQSFTLRHPGLDVSVPAIATPSTDGWGFVQIGSGLTASIDPSGFVSVDVPADPNVQFVVSGEITVRSADGSVDASVSISEPVQLGRVGLDELVSALAIGYDADGAAILVAGGQFGADIPVSPQPADSLPATTLVEQPSDSGTTPPETTAPPPAESATVPVSYRDPPPLFTPVPFATVERPTSVDGDVQFAVGDGLIVAIGADANMNVLDTVTGATTQRQLAAAVSQPVFGPGNLLYGLTFTPPTGESQMPDAAIVAQPIADDPIEIIDAVDVSPLAYLELPLGTLVAGPDGIYDVARSRGKVMDYVGPGTDDLPTPALIDSEPTEGTVVRSGDGSAEWTLAVEQHPNAANPFVGDRPAAPGPNGATRVVRYIGPRLETEPVDFGTPTQPVIADLQPGSGRWWSLPDDWSVAESSARGTLLVRDSGQRFELAWFEPESTD